MTGLVPTSYGRPFFCGWRHLAIVIQFSGLLLCLAYLFRSMC